MNSYPLLDPSFFPKQEIEKQSHKKEMKTQGIFSEMKEKISALFPTNPPTISVNEYSVQEIKRLTPIKNELRYRIAQIDKFVSERKDLKQLCLEYIKKFPDYIVRLKKINLEHFNLEDPVDRLTLLRQKITLLKHELNERMQFIERHTSIYNCFVKHLKKLKKSEFTSQQVKLLLLQASKQENS